MNIWINIIGISVVILALIYCGSRLQMKAWLQELDFHLGKKVADYINNSKKKENGTEEKK